MKNLSIKNLLVYISFLFCLSAMLFTCTSCTKEYTEPGTKTTSSSINSFDSTNNPICTNNVIQCAYHKIGNKYILDSCGDYHKTPGINLVTEQNCSQCDSLFKVLNQ